MYEPMPFFRDGAQRNIFTFQNLSDQNQFQIAFDGNGFIEGSSTIAISY